MCSGPLACKSEVMKKLNFLLKTSVLIAMALVTMFIFVEYYSYIFSRTVTGEILKVEKLDTPMIFSNPGSGSAALPPQAFSFSVSISDKKTGEIVIGTSEDRQWAVVEAGHCATVQFYPYPPWQLGKAGTYHNARVIHLLKSCDDKKDH